MGRRDWRISFDYKIEQLDLEISVEAEGRFSPVYARGGTDPSDDGYARLLRVVNTATGEEITDYMGDVFIRKSLNAHASVAVSLDVILLQEAEERVHDGGSDAK